MEAELQRVLAAHGLGAAVAALERVGVVDKDSLSFVDDEVVQHLMQVERMPIVMSKMLRARLPAILAVARAPAAIGAEQKDVAVLMSRPMVGSPCVHRAVAASAVEAAGVCGQSGSATGGPDLIAVEPERGEGGAACVGSQDRTATGGPDLLAVEPERGGGGAAGVGLQDRTATGGPDLIAVEPERGEDGAAGGLDLIAVEPERGGVGATGGLDLIAVDLERQGVGATGNEPQDKLVTPNADVVVSDAVRKGVDSASKEPQSAPTMAYSDVVSSRAVRHGVTPPSASGNQQTQAQVSRKRSRDVSSTQTPRLPVLTRITQGTTSTRRTFPFLLNLEARPPDAGVIRVPALHPTPNSVLSLQSAVGKSAMHGKPLHQPRPVVDKSVMQAQPLQRAGPTVNMAPDASVVPTSLPQKSTSTGSDKDLVQSAQTLLSLKTCHGEKFPLGLDMESSSPVHDSIEVLRQGLSFRTYVTTARNETCLTIARTFGLEAEAIFEMNSERYPGFRSVRTKLQRGTTIVLPI